jgi:hypothetical protein
MHAFQSSQCDELAVEVVLAQKVADMIKNK